MGWFGWGGSSDREYHKNSTSSHAQLCCFSSLSRAHQVPLTHRDLSLARAYQPSTSVPCHLFEMPSSVRRTRNERSQPSGDILAYSRRRRTTCCVPRTTTASKTVCVSCARRLPCATRTSSTSVWSTLRPRYRDAVCVGVWFIDTERDTHTQTLPHARTQEGIATLKRPPTEYTAAELALLRSQDAAYVQTKLQAELKVLQRVCLSRAMDQDTRY